MSEPVGWQRLDRRAVLVSTLVGTGVAAVGGIPTALNLLRSERPTALVAGLAVTAAVLFVGLSALVGLLRWRFTHYRVTDERVELRFSLISHRLRAIPRERVRTVDLTANPLLRAFGLAKVQIGTGQQSVGGTGNQLVLNPVARPDAERLREHLLNPVAAAPARPQVAVTRPIAELDWSWIRFAPISVTTPILGAAAFGAVLQLADWFGLQQTVIGTAGDWLGTLPLAALLGVLVATGILVGVLGSLGLFVELWWRYRLTRDDNRTLRVQRGLLTTRSLSLEERRLRGVEVVEPLGARLLGAARVDAVATGLRARGKDDRGDPKTLLPAAPRSAAHRVAAAIIGEPVSPTESVRLRGHPSAARGRRLRWALAAVLAPVAVLAGLGALLAPVLVELAVVLAVLGTPVAVGLGLDAYRNLGHGLTGGYLVTRYGSVGRRTVALRRSGIIGWTITSSPFQRRAGLVTIAATTAANRGAYLIRDVGRIDGLRLADEAVPDLLAPFLGRADR